MPVTALIGDAVSSRAAADRVALHAALEAALAEANERLSPATPLRLTVGDEYQGCFATRGAALQATLLLRLRLSPVVGVRHGVGWGEVTVLAEEPRVEDGPAWWAAREAIESVKLAEGRAASRLLRTAFRGPDAELVNAALVGRDELLGHLDERSMSVLSGMLEAMSQQDIADRLEVSPSAVSQRVRRDGLAAILRIDELLGTLP